MVVNTSVVNQTIWCNFRATRLYMELLNNTMLPLEPFEENKKINRMLETINNMVRGAVLSEDNDEQTVSFFQDLISNLISQINWEIQSMNDHVQYEMVDMFQDIDYSHYQKLREFFRDYNGYYDD